MQRKHFFGSFLKLTFLLVVFALAATGCTKKTNTVSSNPTQDGPTDGVGGNGLAGQPLESFAFNPRLSSAYVSEIKPLFDRFNKLLANGNSSLSGSGDKLSITDFFGMRTWYLVPSALKSLDNTRISAGFISDKTQQMAFQTDKEIWIDKNLFDAMTAPDQAKLLLHEYLWIVYRLKYLKFAEICDGSHAELTPLCPNQDVITILDTYYPPNPNHLPADTDYPNIRAAVDYLVTNGATDSLNDIDETLIGLNFDPRFAPPLEPSRAILSQGNSFSAIQTMLTLGGGTLLNRCISIPSLQSSTCDLSQLVNNIQNLEADSLTLVIHAPGIASIQATQQNPLSGTQLEPLGFFNDLGNFRVISTGFPGVTGACPPKIGDIDTRVEIIVKNLQDLPSPAMNDLSIAGLQFLQRVVTEVTEKDEVEPIVDDNDKVIGKKTLKTYTYKYGPLLSVDQKGDQPSVLALANSLTEAESKSLVNFYQGEFNYRSIIAESQSQASCGITE